MGGYGDVRIAPHQVFADTWWAKAQNLAAEVVRSRWFEFTAGFVILLHLGPSGSVAHVASFGAP